MNTHIHTQAHTSAHTHIRARPKSHTRLVTVCGYGVLKKVGRKAEQEADVEDKEEGRAALVVDLDCFLQVGVATSLWSFVEMIQP